MQQLSLFAQPVEELPDINNITIEWLHEYVSIFYPDF